MDHIEQKMIRTARIERQRQERFTAFLVLCAAIAAIITEMIFPDYKLFFQGVIVGAATVSIGRALYNEHLRREENRNLEQPPAAGS